MCNRILSSGNFLTAKIFGMEFELPYPVLAFLKRISDRITANKKYRNEWMNELTSRYFTTSIHGENWLLIFAATRQDKQLIDKVLRTIAQLESSRNLIQKGDLLLGQLASDLIMASLIDFIAFSSRPWIVPNNSHVWLRFVTTLKVWTKGCCKSTFHYSYAGCYDKVIIALV